MTLTARELRDLSAGQIANYVKVRDLSASEVIEAALERMDVFEPYIHAFCAPGHDLARASAAALDERVSKGEVPGHTSFEDEDAIYCFVEDKVESSSPKFIGQLSDYLLRETEIPGTRSIWIMERDSTRD